MKVVSTALSKRKVARSIPDEQRLVTLLAHVLHWTTKEPSPSFVARRTLFDLVIHA